MTTMTAGEITAEARMLTGQLARVSLRGDPFFGGVAVRWGTVAGVAGDRITFAGDLHDCAGILERDQSARIEYVLSIGPKRYLA